MDYVKGKEMSDNFFFFSKILLYAQKEQNRPAIQTNRFYILCGMA